MKKAIVAASELDTRLVMRPLRNTERVLTNEAVERLLEKERALGADLKFEDIIEEVAGVYPRIMSEGDMDAGAWSCGMVAGHACLCLLWLVVVRCASLARSLDMSMIS